MDVVLYLLQEHIATVNFLWDNRNVIIACSGLDINGAVMQYSISDKKPINQEKKEGKKKI